MLESLIQNRLLRHILFWVIAFFGTALVANIHFANFEAALGYTAFLFPIQVAAAYLLLYYQIQELILKKRFILFTFSFLLSAYVFSVLGRIIVVHVVESIWREGVFNQESIWEILTEIPHVIAGYFFRIYSLPIIMVASKMIKDNFEERRKREQLENEKANAELNFLKAQIHPHFLFNTLNNLYALTLQKSDKAPETVLKLSEMMDYMLYQCTSPSVSIGKEIALVQNYIDLETLRYGERLDLKFDCAVDNENSKIAPMILLSLVENAFKHGASGAIGRPRIQIDMQLKNEQLRFHISNSKVAQPMKDQRNFRKGIGGSNIKRQLELIYPGRYELKTNEEENSYEVQLAINLQNPEQ